MDRSWYETTGIAQALARTALAVLDHPEIEGRALVEAQAMMDHLWGQGFRPQTLDDRKARAR